MFKRSKRILRRSKMLEFLDGLSASGGDTLTIYLPPRLRDTDVRTLLKELNTPTDIVDDIVKTATASKTGAVVFGDAECKYMILPPFPIEDTSISHNINTNTLHTSLSKDYLIALVLVRLGSYGIGVYRGEKRISSKVGTGLVHGRHHQGGSSAHRFERHRDKQIESFLTRVCQHAREHIEPYVKSLDYIIYGGARTTIQLLQKQCPLLQDLTTPALPPLLDIPEPRQAVLEAAITRVWSTTVFEWCEC